MATITKQNIIIYAQWRYGEYPLPKKLTTMTVEEILKEYEWSREEVQKFIDDYIVKEFKEHIKLDKPNIYSRSFDSIDWTSRGVTLQLAQEIAASMQLMCEQGKNISSRWVIKRADDNNMNNDKIMQELKAMFMFEVADHNRENYAGKLEDYVNKIIKRFNLDEVALKLDVTDRIDFIFGLPIRRNRKTISCNPVITKEVWEFLRDIYSEQAIPLRW